jgi:hypothetical protein
MKTVNSPEDEELQSLLREVRPAPALPPRFAENVWRRIEAGERNSTSVESGWLQGLAGWLLKPKLALALATVVVLAGVGMGWNVAQHQVQAEAQARYLAAVAPNSLR